MTKKDYVLIAGALNRTRNETLRPDSEGIAWVDYAASILATALASDNPRFDRARFLSAVRGEN